MNIDCTETNIVNTSDEPDITEQDSESNIEYWSESSGSEAASCYLSQCECHGSDSDSDSYDGFRYEGFHDYKTRYQFDVEHDSYYFLTTCCEYVYDRYKNIKDKYEANNFENEQFTTKLPSRALLKFMEKNRFDFLTFVRNPGMVNCEWCGFQINGYVYHMRMQKKDMSFDVCRRCMVELQPILENYEKSVMEFKKVLKKNKSLWIDKGFHNHNNDLDFIYEDILHNFEKSENEEQSENEEYRELTDDDIKQHMKTFTIGPQFTETSAELPNKTVTDQIVYTMIMGCPKLVLRRNTCINCDICKQSTKLSIVVHTTDNTEKYELKTNWDICVKCVYRFDYLIVSYLVNKWDMVKEGKISEYEKLMAMRSELLAPVHSTKI